jgi:hypothetical protein
VTASDWMGQGPSQYLEREAAERAAHYRELHPDRPSRASLMSIIRRVAARLPSTSRPNRSRTERPSEDVWAHEEALYRAKNERK